MIIEYSSRRREVMAWYWRTWLNSPRLVRQRLIIFVSVAGLSFLARRTGTAVATSPSVVADAVRALGSGCGALMLLAVFPLIMFKPQKRVLTTSPSGVDTTIGKMSGQLPWTNVASVRQDGDKIVISNVNGNAFVIPPRAFGHEASRQEFFAEALAWYKASRGS